MIVCLFSSNKYNTLAIADGSVRYVGRRLAAAGRPSKLPRAFDEIIYAAIYIIPRGELRQRLQGRTKCCAWVGAAYRTELPSATDAMTSGTLSRPTNR